MHLFKLDENLSPSLKEPLREAGYQAVTVAQQSLRGSRDAEIAEACRSEGRCLITADEGFAQIVQYPHPPRDYRGIVVLRHPRPSLQRLQLLMRQVVKALAKEDVTGRLWIVEPGRIRIHE